MTKRWESKAMLNADEVTAELRQVFEAQDFKITKSGRSAFRATLHKALAGAEVNVTVAAAPAGTKVSFSRRTTGMLWVFWMLPVYACTCGGVCGAGVVGTIAVYSSARRRTSALIDECIERCKAIEAVPQEYTFCDRCGAPLREGAKFCGRCGTKM
ncbi:MAG: zinc ribbon domain-containing protein [Kiritimatiellae bacterium]|nr:zinc ribbon domain-containing protein [Kiritimatiellia bacterium]